MFLKSYKSVLTFSLSLSMLLSGCTSDESSSNQETSPSKNLVVPSKQIFVVAGDVLKVKWKDKEETVHLLSIDTPDLDHPRYGKEPFSEEAKTFTATLINSAKKVTLVKDQQKRDQQGNLLVHVYVNGKSIEKALLENGLARVDTHTASSKKIMSEFLNIQDKSRDKKLGIWSIANYVQSDGYHPEVQGEFIASKNSDVYHKVTCSEAKSIQDTNKIYFKTEEEAKASGRKRSKSPSCWQ
ncbi:thermonuclease family protein [Thermoflavimicrobium daqui]|uniref:TNase-like domain-containing protein n=1 Tax=Thermoflavimicrobium daqui TaxID=2137476 RepID=A0A364K6P9_9BACL|nr:thermonuclease family protein [Thermoflavimicrobium daqui]RAL25870.1 hypothetical protein DL897_07275 [Thermoflavimicrobium daqui]